MDRTMVVRYLTALRDEIADDKRLYTWAENVREADDRIAAINTAIGVMERIGHSRHSGRREGWETMATNVSGGVRECVQWFATQMERRLAANDHKPGWQFDGTAELLRRLREETDELEAAINGGDPPGAVQREAADVANFAMMIADNLRLHVREQA